MGQALQRSHPSFPTDATPTGESAMSQVARKVANGGNQLCQHCSATLRTSGKGFVYCPNIYNDANPCPFQGWKAEAKPVAVAGAGSDEILPLPTASDEQAKIIADAEAQKATTGIYNAIIRALAGTGKTTVLVQLVRVFAQLCGFSVMCLAFAKRDRKALESRVKGRAKVMTNNGAGLALVGTWARMRGCRNLRCEDDVVNMMLRQRWMDDGLLTAGGPDAAGIEQRQEWKEPYSTFAAIAALADKVRTCMPLKANKAGYAKRPTDQDFLDIAERFDVEVKTEAIPLIIFYSQWLFDQLRNIENVLVWGIDMAGQTFLPVYHDLMPAKRFKRVLVDESQDQNFTNRELAFLYCEKGGSVIAVGDENQAIYAWRGADRDALTEMTTAMGRTGEAKSYPLTLCRRCPKVAIREAQKLVPGIQALPEAIEGTHTFLDNGDALYAKLKAARKGLVICRANAPLVSMALKLLSNGIPAQLLRSNVTNDLLRLIDQLSALDGSMPIVDLIGKAKEWLEERLAKFSKQRNGAAKAQVASDKVDCLNALSEAENVRTSGDLKRKINTMFPLHDEPDSTKIVILSTVHGAKGSEAEDVYLYSPDGMKVSIWDQVWSDSTDRDNTLYVAITRVEKNLTYVGIPPTMRRFSDDETEEDGEGEANEGGIE